MLKRTLAILATGAVGALALAPSAGAQDTGPELKPYGAGAFASALEVTLLGQDLAVSNTSAAITSTPEAKSDGSALLLAGTPLPGNTPSSYPDGKDKNKSCALDLNLGQLTGGAISLADAGLACINTTASHTDKTATAPGITTATSASGELIINVTAPAGDVLKPILDPLGSAVQDQVLAPLLDALAPLTGGIKDATQIDLPAVINDLVGSLLSVDPNVVIAQIAVAPSGSSAGFNSDTGVAALAGSSGATITILPDLLQNLLDIGLNIPAIGPLATIKVGASQAGVAFDKDAKPKADASSAKILDVQLAPSLGILSQITGQLTSALEQLAGATGALGCNANNPLAGIVCIDLGSVRELTTQEMKDHNLWFGDGTIGREASAATVRVLSIASDSLGGDVLGIRLGSSDASANAAITTPDTVPTPIKLPKTGGTPSLPVALVLMLGAGGLAALVRRTRTSAV
jgi:hypothetical protein